jgi:2-hydroxy-6-oxonona-2,4-dienedioate hydrolase
MAIPYQMQANPDPDDFMQLVTVLLSILFLGIAVFLVRFSSWRQRIARSLVADSVVIKTSRGLVEYADIGEGVPVLFLHGSPGGYDQILAGMVAKGMAGRAFRAIIPSRPGYLRTPIDSGRTPAEQATLYDALLDALGVPRAFVLGASGGGPSALQFAILYPERCAGLILCEAAVRRIAVRYFPIPAILVDALIFLTRGRAAARLRASGVTDAVAIKIAQSAGDTVARFERRTLGMRNDFQYYATMEDMALEAIRCPTLIVHGTLDRQVPVAHAEYAHAHIAGSRLQWIEGAGHEMPATHHEEMDAHIHAFISEHRKGINPGGALP